MAFAVEPDHVPTEGELNNIAYLTFKYGVNWGMRSCDFHVCKMVAGDLKGEEGLKRFIETVAEYGHDHILGEPESPTVQEIIDHMTPMLEAWWNGVESAERSRID